MLTWHLLRGGDGIHGTPSPNDCQEPSSEKPTNTMNNCATQNSERYRLEYGVQKMLTGTSGIREGGSVNQVEVPEAFGKGGHSKKENDDTNQSVCRI